MKRILVPLIFGLALGLALSFFFAQLPYWLSTTLICVGAGGLIWWAWRQLRWARAQLRELKQLGDE